MEEFQEKVNRRLDIFFSINKSNLLCSLHREVNSADDIWRQC